MERQNLKRRKEDCCLCGKYCDEDGALYTHGFQAPLMQFELEDIAAFTVLTEIQSLHFFFLLNA
jgi:hypothetical protein